MISIVMSYYNRIEHLRHTLKTINECNEKDFEVVIVDDFSSSEHKLDHIQTEFPSLNLNIVHMANEVTEKWYRNPCVPFNVGFRKSSGDKIIIQNPECCHVGNLIEHTRNSLHDGNYLSFHCYATGVKDTNRIRKGKIIKYNDVALKSAKGLESKWYNHQSFRPASYNFATAITRKNLVALNGFDERYALGHNCDDDDFIHRIVNMGLKIDFVHQPHVIHQYHGVGVSSLMTEALADNRALWKKLKQLNYVKAPNEIDII